MASTTQIVPEHDYSHVMTVIHDNSARPADTLGNTQTTYCNMMFVFSSPKGIDRELQTVSGGMSDFIEKYGYGTYDTCGQPYLNAYAAASTNAATLHCLRVTADDATYAVGALVAHYKAEPGSSAVEPTPVPSELIDTMGHEGLVATDETDEATGAITITVAGTDIESGISGENADLFGTVDSEVVDLTLNLSKIVELDDDKTYQVTQVNPALANYVGKDEFVSEVLGQYVKTKTYTGAALKEGYSIIVGAQTSATVSVVEWGAVEPTVVVVNNTDLGIVSADKKAALNVTSVGSDYTVVASDEAVAGVVNADLWGAISGNHLELDLTFPNISSDKNYRVIQTNANLEIYSADPSVSQVDGEWKKTKEYSGADIADGYAVLLGDGKGDITVKVFEADGFVSEADSVPTCTVTVQNGYQFVSQHPEEDSNGPIGDPVEVTVNAALSFTTTTTKSTILRATARRASVLRSITPEAEAAVPGTMDVYYTFESVEGITDTSDLGNLVQVDHTPDADGYTALKLFEICARGRGNWGNNIRFVLESYARGDRLSNYKNYTLSIYEISNATLTKKEEFTISFNANAVNDSTNTAIFADYVVGDPFDMSDYVHMASNTAAFSELFAAYATVFPDTTLTEETFDPICGMVFGTSVSTIEGLTIDTTSAGTVSVSGASGIGLLNGSDGAFSEDNADRQTALNNAYLKAYSGEIDRNVRSRKMFPTDLILDANFDTETKIAIHELCIERTDCVAIYDLGTNLNTFASVLENLADIEPYITNRSEMIDGYRGKIQDPVTSKVVNVTSTYALAQMYPTHFQESGGKHVPLAGSSYGVMSGFLSGSAYPVFDEDLDSAYMDQLTTNKVNYLEVNTKKQVIRGAQTTRQDADTNLSEGSNVFVLNDITRDCRQLCEQYHYNFSESSDLQRFNKAAKILAEKYQDSQVSSISAEFSMNDWESERGILHLYVDFVHKNIIKRSIVEISVNRGTVTV